jgi:Holliday junction resolvase RusA-like endonuclease
VIILDLPFPPSVNHLFATVRQGAGLRRVVSLEYKNWRAISAWEIKRQRPKCASGRVEVSITFEEKKGRRDIDNLLKPILDCLVDNGVIGGDSSKTVRKITAQWGDVLGARIEIAKAA